jgi:hypothetical protein
MGVSWHGSAAEREEGFMANARSKGKASPKRKRRKIGKKRTVGKAAHAKVASAIKAARDAKVELEKQGLGGRAAWKELHNVECRLGRLT